MFKIIKNIYNNLKPLLIFLFSLIVVFLAFKSFFSSYGPLKDGDNNLNFWLGFFTLILGILSSILELLIKMNVSVINVEIADENKLKGSTPLYLDKKNSYKTIYICTHTFKIKNDLIDSSDYFKVVFPTGVSVNLENYDNVLTTCENEIIFSVKKHGIDKVGTRYIPVNIELVTENFEEVEGGEIKIIDYLQNKKKINKVLTEVNKSDKSITLKKDD